jgi:hypothetical protein
MGLPNGQLQILVAIENELQVERLGTPDSLPGRRTSRSVGVATFPGQPLKGHA